MLGIGPRRLCVELHSHLRLRRCLHLHLYPPLPLHLVVFPCVSKTEMLFFSIWHLLGLSWLDGLWPCVVLLPIVPPLVFAVLLLACVFLELLCVGLVWVVRQYVELCEAVCWSC